MLDLGYILSHPFSTERTEEAGALKPCPGMSEVGGRGKAVIDRLQGYPDVRNAGGSWAE